EDISSVLVATSIGQIGIVTERDLLRALRREPNSSAVPTLEEIVTSPLEAIDQDAFVYRAIGRITRLGLPNLAVGDGRGKIVGMLSTRDLLSRHAAAALALGDEVDCADGVVALAAAWGRLPLVVRGLLDDHTDPGIITQVI